jgi:hypothetical protein
MPSTAVKRRNQPNKGLEPTADSVRSTPASGSGSRSVLEPQVPFSCAFHSWNNQERD